MFVFSAASVLHLFLHSAALQDGTSKKSYKYVPGSKLLNEVVDTFNPGQVEKLRVRAGLPPNPSPKPFGLEMVQKSGG